MRRTHRAPRLMLRIRSRFGFRFKLVSDFRGVLDAKMRREGREGSMRGE